MAFSDHDQDEFQITIEDVFGFSRSMPVAGEALFEEVTPHPEDGLLNTSSYSPTSPSVESYSPSSSESLYSLGSNVESPLWYSPTSSCHLSAIGSPYSTVSEELCDAPHSTVSPQDITSNPFDSGFWNPSAHAEDYEQFIEPLFEVVVGEYQNELVAIDGMDSQAATSSTLFASQKATDLRIAIPTSAPSRPSTPIPYNSSSPPPTLSTQCPSRECSESPEESDVLSQYSDSPYPSPSPSLSPLPGYSQRLRRDSSSSDSILRVPSSPNRGLARHHPYERKTEDADYATAAEAASMTLEGYLVVVSCLRPMKTFQDQDFRKGLPPIVKPIVGSDQTRKASEERRTDTTTFFCPIPRCGSTFTKKHNLNYHIKSHFNADPPFRCPVCNKGIGHSASLQRHMKLHEGTGSRSHTSSHAHSKAKKRGKKH